MTGTAPWAVALATVRTVPDLATLWREWSADAGVQKAVETYGAQGLDVTPAEISQLMRTDWARRQTEIEVADVESPPPSPEQVASAREKLEKLMEDSYQATLDYGVAARAWAESHAKYKATRAKRYLRAKADGIADGGKMTNGEAEMITDADDEVATLYLQSEIDEGLVRAARARLDHVDRSFNYYRSVFVREDRADQRG